MELKVQVPFEQFLTIVKTLTPEQKRKLQEVLHQTERVESSKEAYLELLLNGPVYTEAEIKTIEENRKSIAKWRKKG